MPKSIVAMGGGGFSMDDPLLDDYILSLAPDNPRICFLPTASGDNDHYIVRFYRAFARRARATHLSLNFRTETDIEGFLSAQDIVYVGGGNTANMLAIWRLHGVDAALRRAWEKGVLLCGLSAGAMCWFEAGVTDSFGPLAVLQDGVGLLPGSMCPHFNGDPGRSPLFHALIASGTIPEGVGIDDYCAVRYADSEPVEVVPSRPGAGARRIHKDGTTSAL